MNAERGFVIHLADGRKQVLEGNDVGNSFVRFYEVLLREDDRVDDFVRCPD